MFGEGTEPEHALVLAPSTPLPSRAERKNAAQNVRIDQKLGVLKILKNS